MAYSKRCLCLFSVGLFLLAACGGTESFVPEVVGSTEQRLTYTSPMCTAQPVGQRQSVETFRYFVLSDSDLGDRPERAGAVFARTPEMSRWTPFALHNDQLVLKLVGKNRYREALREYLVDAGKLYAQDYFCPCGFVTVSAAPDSQQVSYRAECRQIVNRTLP
jgi:hypothetical protein